MGIFTGYKWWIGRVFLGLLSIQLFLCSTAEAQLVSSMEVECGFQIAAKVGVTADLHELGQAIESYTNAKLQRPFVLHNEQVYAVVVGWGYAEGSYCHSLVSFTYRSGVLGNYRRLFSRFNNEKGSRFHVIQMAVHEKLLAIVLYDRMIPRSQVKIVDMDVQQFVGFYDSATGAIISEISIGEGGLELNIVGHSLVLPAGIHWFDLVPGGPRGLFNIEHQKSDTE